MGCPFSRKGCQCHRGQCGIHINLKKAPINGEDHNEGQHRNKKASQQRHQPKGDTCQKAHISDGVCDFLRQRHGCAGQAADAARRRCHNAVAHIKYIYQQVHTVGDTQLCQHKVDKVPQQIQKRKERLIEITADGEISGDEIADFVHIQEELERISITVETLQLWSERMLAMGAIDMEAYKAHKGKK